MQILGRPQRRRPGARALPPTTSRVPTLAILAAALAAPALLTAPPPAAAQTIEELLRERDGAGAPGAPGAATPEGEEAEAAKPKLSPEEALEQAFKDLTSQEEPIWRAAERRIVKARSASGSDSMDLLLKRGRDAMEKEDFEAAIDHLTDLVNLAPDFAEGWNVRAAAHFRNESPGAALADLGEAIALDPRHYAAYAGLGVILEQFGEKAQAMEAYRKALAIHPHLENAQNAVKRLAPDAEGRPI